MPEKLDFRRTLNTVLGVYYDKASPIFIHQELAHEFSSHDLTAAFGTLVKDGYVEQVAPGYSAVPLGCITGQGRIFHENRLQGGAHKGRPHHQMGEEPSRFLLDLHLCCHARIPQAPARFYFTDHRIIEKLIFQFAYNILEVVP